MVRRTSRVTGITLVELLVSVAIMGAVGVVLLVMLGQGRRGAALAGEVQMAVTLGARAMDVLGAQGHTVLSGRAGSEGNLMLGRMGAGGQGGAGDPTKLVIDGITFMGWCKFAALKPGLLRVDVTIMWEGIRGPERVSGFLPLVRVMADPGHGITFRGAPAGGAA